MAAESPQRPGAEAFTAPDQINQRRYEAIRAYYVEGLTYQQAGDRYGYTRWAMIDLVRQYKAGKLTRISMQGVRRKGLVELVADGSVAEPGDGGVGG